MAARSGWALLAAALLTGGCAGVAEVTGTATQDDMTQLRAELATVQSSVRQLRAQIDALQAQPDTQLREQIAERDRSANSLAGRLEGLSTTLTQLTARAEELAARIDGLGRQLRAPGPPAPPGAPAPPVTPPTAAPITPRTPAPPMATAPPAASAPPPLRPTTGALQPQDIYQAAYIDFSKGSYTLAIAGFRDFLRRFPDHELADNAQYWIGEAHFSLARGHADAGQPERAREELGRAVQEFRKVVANHPRGDKAPTALYKEALTLLELKQPHLAQARLQYLVDNFPQAEETPLARERLAALKDR